jgi:hypothetical protein
MKVRPNLKLPRTRASTRSTTYLLDWRSHQARDLSFGFGGRPEAGKAVSLLWNDAGVAAGSAGRWDDWRDTAPGQGCRNAGIDFGGRTNHTLGPRQLIAQIGAAVSFSLRAGTDKPPVLASQPSRASHPN